MRRSINFGSIFRRKDDQQPADSSEQAARGLLAQRLAERKVTLKESDLEPLTAGTPPLDWANVNSQLTLRAGSIDGLLQGRARIRAGHLKTLTPSPIGPEVPDDTEYAVALAAVIPQIDDLLQSSEAETSPEPEFDTPFTALAEEDRARFENANNKNSEPNSHSQTAFAGERASSTDVESPQAIRTEKRDGEEPPQDQQSFTALRTDSRPSVGQPEPRAQAQDVEDKATQHLEPQSFQKDPGGAHADSPRCEPDEDPARRGVEQLQEIFMVDEPLDGRRVALLVRQFPGVTGALILLEGGAVLGGQLPDWLSREAALQAPEVLAHFVRFIVELESGRQAQSRFVSVTSATTISLVGSGQIVLLVSHQTRKLPPGLARRLTEIAEALNLIYGNACS
jgi:hypothetical protein